MAQGKTRNSDRSQQVRSAPKVNLYCKDCNSQLGIFNNEWIHLTPSYAAPKEKGKNFGTRIGDSTKKVPDGGVHKMAAGCEMAEIFCESCNMHIGQHCEEAPESKRSQMVGKHFYKLTKTYLKDAKTAKTTDPRFVDGEEFVPSTPVRRKMTTKVVTPEARRKSTPTSTSETTAQDSQRSAPVRTSPRNSNTEDQNELAKRLADLERLMRGGLPAPTASARPETFAPAPQAYGYTSQGPGASTSQQEQVIEDQRKQIASMTAQVDSLRGTIEDLREIIKDLRADKARRETVTLQESTVLSRFDEMLRSVRDGQSKAAEADRLRADNDRLKERVSTMAGAIGVSSDASEEEIRAKSNLGKRKRDEEHTGRSSFRSFDAGGQNGGYAAGNASEQFHLPSPESLQEPVNGRGVTPAIPPPPQSNPYSYQHGPAYGPRPLRHQHSEPGMSRYATPGASYSSTNPPEHMFSNPIDRVARQEGLQMTRSESRAGRRSAFNNANKRITNRYSDGDALGESVDFSDDEIATPAPGDAPLSVPRKRPVPPIFGSSDDRRGSRMGSVFPGPSFPDTWQGHGVLHPPAQPRPHKPPPVPKPGRCTSLRQPNLMPGINNALVFTPDEVAKRMENEKPRGRGRAGKETASSRADAEDAEPAEISIPIDPALEDAASRSNSLGDESDGHGSDGEDPRPSKGRSSTQKRT